MSKPLSPHLEKIRALSNGQTVRYRTGTDGRHVTEWTPWQIGEIYLQKRTKALPGKNRRGLSWQEGAVLTLTPKAVGTAEYSEDDYDPEYDTFSVEEYHLQIDWAYIPGAAQTALPVELDMPAPNRNALLLVASRLYPAGTTTPPDEWTTVYNRDGVAFNYHPEETAEEDLIEVLSATWINSGATTQPGPNPDKLLLTEEDWSPHVSALFASHTPSPETNFANTLFTTVWHTDIGPETRIDEGHHEITGVLEAIAGKWAYDTQQRAQLEKQVCGCLRSAVNAHGDITWGNAHSAAKRIVGALKVFFKPAP